MDAGYDGRQVVGIDLHRRRSVIVRMAADTGERLGTARIDNDPMALGTRLRPSAGSPTIRSGHSTVVAPSTGARTRRPW